MGNADEEYCSNRISMRPRADDLDNTFHVSKLYSLFSELALLYLDAVWKSIRSKVLGTNLISINLLSVVPPAVMHG